MIADEVLERNDYGQYIDENGLICCCATMAHILGIRSPHMRAQACAKRPKKFKGWFKVVATSPHPIACYGIINGKRFTLGLRQSRIVAKHGSIWVKFTSV